MGIGGGVGGGVGVKLELSGRVSYRLVPLLFPEACDVEMMMMLMMGYRWMMS